MVREARRSEYLRCGCLQEAVDKERKADKHRVVQEEDTRNH